MTSDTPDTLLTALQAERRPAIWPWLVMPLITLMLFYGLDRLYRNEREMRDMAPVPASHISSDSEDS